MNTMDVSNSKEDEHPTSLVYYGTVVTIVGINVIFEQFEQRLLRPNRMMYSKGPDEDWSVSPRGWRLSRRFWRHSTAGSETCRTKPESSSEAPTTRRYGHVYMLHFELPGEPVPEKSLLLLTFVPTMVSRSSTICDSHLARRSPFLMPRCLF